MYSSLFTENGRHFVRGHFVLTHEAGNFFENWPTGTLSAGQPTGPM